MKLTHYPMERGLAAFSRAKKGQDQDRPQIISLNAKSKPVFDRAKQLAGAGRQDAQSPAELQALAGGRRRTLRQVGRASRFGGYHHELREANLAHRLLEAALTRNPVAPVTLEDQKGIESVEGFSSLPPSAQWARLNMLQPLLIGLEADVQAGHFGEVGNLPPSVRVRAEHAEHTPPVRDGSWQVSRSDKDPPFTEEEIRQIRDHGRRHNKLMERLKSLVGPDSAHDDLLLRSQRVFEIAHARLPRPSD